jgi:effector-binding domain-containing protein
VREVVPTIQDMPERCTAMYLEALGWAQRNGAQIAGACMGLYHTSGYTERDIDTEMAIPIEAGSLRDAGRPAGGVRVGVRELPGAERMASVIHRGPYDDLTLAWQALGRWVETNGYRMAGPGRELYLRTPEAGDPLAEVQVPIEPA